MDFLDFPPNNYAIDYSVPRVCHVQTSDFVFAVSNDLERKILNNTRVLGWRPVSLFLDDHTIVLFLVCGIYHASFYL